MFRKLLAAISVGIFAMSAAAVAADSAIPGSPSEGALGNWTDRNVAFEGKPAKPTGIPLSQFEGALGTVQASGYSEPAFQGTAAQPTSIPSSPSEGAID